MPKTALKRGGALILALWLAAGAMAAAQIAPGDGKAQFAANCSLCHSAEPDDGGGMGPALHGLFNRPAATADKSYPYTQALRDSKIVWDAASLDRYLAAPGNLAPGTSMTATLSDQNERDAIIAYIRALETPRP